MTPELTVALEQLREDLRQEIRASAADTRAYIDASTAETRALLETSTAETRAYIDASTAELRASLEASTAETRALLEASTAETRAYVDRGLDGVRQEIRDTRRELGVLIEDLRGSIQVVAEGVVGLNQKFDAFLGDRDPLRRRVDLVEDRVAVLEQHVRPPRRKR